MYTVKKKKNNFLSFERCKCTTANINEYISINSIVVRNQTKNKVVYIL